MNLFFIIGILIISIWSALGHDSFHNYGILHRLYEESNNVRQKKFIFIMAGPISWMVILITCCNELVVNFIKYINNKLGK